MIELDSNEEAQLILDLKKELGFNDIYFEEKISYLLGYSEKINEDVSEKAIRDFYWADKTNPDFTFEPKKNTKKISWK